MNNPFSDRVRFNWGYHDAAFELKTGIVRPNAKFRLPNNDKAYCDGYAEGLHDAKNGNYRDDSTLAWKRNQTFKNGITGRLQAAGF